MKNLKRSPGNPPKSQAVYIPGPLVGPVKALVSAYYENSAAAIAEALAGLEQTVQNWVANPSMRSGTRRGRLATHPAKTGSIPLRKPSRIQYRGETPPAEGVMPVRDGEGIDLVARLNRDFPDIAERYAMGEFRTAREAALAAGINLAGQ